MLGLYIHVWAAGWRKRTQTAGSVLLLAAPFLLLLAFINEPGRGVGVDLRESSFGMFLLFGGSMLDAILGIGKRAEKSEAKGASAGGRMKVPAALPVVVTVAGFAVSIGFAQGQAKPVEADFRGAVWGMTRAQVTATEAHRPVRVSQSGGEIVLQYDASKLGPLNGRPIYIFAHNQLVRAKFVVEEEHRDQNELIRNFHALETVLKEKYGKPNDERAIWEDDSTQDETKNYLDQDRATASSILPSDRFVGLAVALGHLRLYTIREDGRTRVLHVLAGRDHEITHQVEYRAVAQ